MSRRVSEYVLWEQFKQAGTDPHGEPIGEYLPPQRLGIYALDEGSSSEPRMPGHDRVIVEPTIYFPMGKEPGHRDRITARGKVYEVEGETRNWPHPNQGPKGAVISVRRVDG
ncbi:hypothetical protein D9V32_13480 [Mycetocola tolaasinivorans]|uniref:Head-tail adaptor protein n=1 Tax=Mycetocola tolaasinivorans TaxID=76635 RepID=A0A3L7A2Q6_9MICO|nr:hypothetical protein D9V32_13480 [Mycetocola tolaasinivorans]